MPVHPHQGRGGRIGVLRIHQGIHVFALVGPRAAVSVSRHLHVGDHGFTVCVLDLLRRRPRNSWTFVPVDIAAGPHDAVAAVLGQQIVVLVDGIRPRIVAAVGRTGEVVGVPLYIDRHDMQHGIYRSVKPVRLMIISVLQRGQEASASVG